MSTPVGDKVLRLYTSNVTPAETTTVGPGVGQLTQATQAGYTPYTLTTANWTTSQDGSGTTTGLYSAVTFTFSTNADVYGYYVTDTTLTGLLWCERFSGSPFSLPTGGGTLAVSCRIELA